ncbi:MAG: hypothetical protein ACP5G2_00725 [Candidatus Bipolaricaulaceae bacterium]
MAALLVVLGGLGWLYGARFVAMHRLGDQAHALQVREELLRQAIADLQGRLAAADHPAVVEEEARRILGWGFPDEERLLLTGR